MELIFHPAAERGHNQFSWLNSYHSFSFGHFFDENKVHFGALRVLNDDTVAPGGGFGTHPHDNMEIVSIPLSGALEHKDSIGSAGVIQAGDVQIMSAGTGIMHSEFNHSLSEEVKFLQVWVFPRERQIAPRYDQKTFAIADSNNQWQVIVDPRGDKGVLINQECWFSQTQLDAGVDLIYTLNRPGNGVYFFVISGTLSIANQEMGPRDALGVSGTSEVNLHSQLQSRILAIEVPMNLV